MATQIIELASGNGKEELLSKLSQILAAGGASKEYDPCSPEEVLKFYLPPDQLAVGDVVQVRKEHGCVANNLKLHTDYVVARIFTDPKVRVEETTGLTYVLDCTLAVKIHMHDEADAPHYHYHEVGANRSWLNKIGSIHQQEA